MTVYRRLHSNHQQVGFSLIELLIAVAIIGIISAIALPSYSEYVSQSRRADGISELSRIMQRQEKYFINSLTYSTDFSELGLVTTGDGVESEAGYYNVEANACDDSTIARCVILTARPQGAQENDGWLSLTSRGQRDWEKNTGDVTGWP